MMLSEECSYTFGSVVKAVGRVRVWKSCRNGKCHTRSPLRMGLRSYRGTECLGARLSCEGPTGMVFEILLRY